MRHDSLQHGSRYVPLRQPSPGLQASTLASHMVFESTRQLPSSVPTSHTGYATERATTSYHFGRTSRSPALQQESSVAPQVMAQRVPTPSNAATSLPNYMGSATLGEQMYRDAPTDGGQRRTSLGHQNVLTTSPVVVRRQSFHGASSPQRDVAYTATQRRSPVLDPSKLDHAGLQCARQSPVKPLDDVVRRTPIPLAVYKVSSGISSSSTDAFPNRHIYYEKRLDTSTTTTNYMTEIQYSRNASAAPTPVPIPLPFRTSHSPQLDTSFEATSSFNQVFWPSRMMTNTSQHPQPHQPRVLMEPIRQQTSSLPEGSAWLNIQDRSDISLGRPSPISIPSSGEVSPRPLNRFSPAPLLSPQAAPPSSVHRSSSGVHSPDHGLAQGTNRMYTSSSIPNLEAHDRSNSSMESTPLQNRTQSLCSPTSDFTPLSPQPAFPFPLPSPLQPHTIRQPSPRLMFSPTAQDHLQPHQWSSAFGTGNFNQWPLRGPPMRTPLSPEEAASRMKFQSFQPTSVYKNERPRSKSAGDAVRTSSPSQRLATASGLSIFGQRPSVVRRLSLDTSASALAAEDALVWDVVAESRILRPSSLPFASHLMSGVNAGPHPSPWVSSSPAASGSTVPESLGYSDNSERHFSSANSSSDVFDDTRPAIHNASSSSVMYRHGAHLTNIVRRTYASTSPSLQPSNLTSYAPHRTASPGLQDPRDGNLRTSSSPALSQYAPNALLSQYSSTQPVVRATTYRSPSPSLHPAAVKPPPGPQIMTSRLGGVEMRFFGAANTPLATNSASSLSANGFAPFQKLGTVGATRLPEQRQPTLCDASTQYVPMDTMVPQPESAFSQVMPSVQALPTSDPRLPTVAVDDVASQSPNKDDWTCQLLTDPGTTIPRSPSPVKELNQEIPHQQSLASKPGEYSFTLNAGLPTEMPQEETVSAAHYNPSPISQLTTETSSYGAHVSDTTISVSTGGFAAYTPEPDIASESCTVHELPPRRPEKEEEEEGDTFMGPFGEENQTASPRATSSTTEQSPTTSDKPAYENDMLASPCISSSGPPHEGTVQSSYEPISPTKDLNSSLGDTGFYQVSDGSSLTTEDDLDPKSPEGGEAEDTEKSPQFSSAPSGSEDRNDMEPDSGGARARPPMGTVPVMVIVEEATHLDLFQPLEEHRLCVLLSLKGEEHSTKLAEPSQQILPHIGSQVLALWDEALEIDSDWDDDATLEVSLVDNFKGVTKPLGGGQVILENIPVQEGAITVHVPLWEHFEAKGRRMKLAGCLRLTFDLLM